MEDEIKNLNLDTKTTNELTIIINQFEQKVSNSLNVKQKNAFTRAMSIVKEKLLIKNNPNADMFDVLQQEIEVWSVLLMNKSNSGFGGRLLKNISNSDIDMTHVIVITKKWPPIKFAHSWSKFKWKWEWVETDVDLISYLKKHHSDVVITTPPLENREKAMYRVENGIHNDENYWYSSRDALLGIMWKASNNEGKFNCWAYVAYVLWLDNNDNELSVPNNWLSDKRLKPTYMFTYPPKNT